MNAFFGGLTGAAVGSIVALLIWFANVDPAIDDDYICICQAGAGGDPESAVAYDVGTGQPNPNRTCPHRNSNNVFGCDLPR